MLWLLKGKKYLIFVYPDAKIFEVLYERKKGLNTILVNFSSSIIIVNNALIMDI